jgi:hypothetical protein
MERDFIARTPRDGAEFSLLRPLAAGKRDRVPFDYAPLEARGKQGRPDDNEGKG